MRPLASSLVVGQHEIPAVEAVLAAVGDDVARQPHSVFSRPGHQERPPAAVDARDLLVGLQHRPSMPRPVVP